MKSIKKITTCLLLFSLSFCTTQMNAQTDSTVNNDELISPTNMEAPGITAFLSASSYYLDHAYFVSATANDTTYFKTEKKTMTLFFDPKTVAMKIEFAEEVKRTIKVSEMTSENHLIYVKSEPVGKIKQEPMYFDNSGYVYVGDKKKGYMKVPFEKLSKLMPGQGFLSGIPGLPGIGYPDGSVTYYGMDVSPKKFPVLEWAFVYKAQNIDGNPDFAKEILNCIVDENCIKYTQKSGEQAGSYVLFDSKGRLREIHTNNNGFIIYSYQEVTVKLPPAKEMPFF